MAYHGQLQRKSLSDSKAAGKTQQELNHSYSAKPSATIGAFHHSRQTLGLGETQEKLDTSQSPSQLITAPPVRRNQTGMPDRIKAGLEQLSGLDLSNVRTNYNSSKPAQINAHAYTQGQTIEIGPGQERHLAHEGWHVVQQLQGRVRPNQEIMGVSINSERSLENEAHVMAEKIGRGGSLHSDINTHAHPLPSLQLASAAIQRVDLYDSVEKGISRGEKVSKAQVSEAIKAFLKDFVSKGRYLNEKGKVIDAQLIDGLEISFDQDYGMTAQSLHLPSLSDVITAIKNRTLKMALRHEMGHMIRKKGSGHSFRKVEAFLKQIDLPRFVFGMMEVNYDYWEEEIRADLKGIYLNYQQTGHLPKGNQLTDFESLLGEKGGQGMDPMHPPADLRVHFMHSFIHTLNGERGNRNGASRLIEKYRDQNRAKKNKLVWTKFYKAAKDDVGNDIFWRFAVITEITKEDQAFEEFVDGKGEYYADTLSEITEGELEELNKLEDYYKSYIGLKPYPIHKELLFAAFKSSWGKLTRTVTTQSSADQSGSEIRLTKIATTLIGMIDGHFRKNKAARTVPDSLRRDPSALDRFADAQGPGPEVTPTGLAADSTFAQVAAVGHALSSQRKDEVIDENKAEALSAAFEAGMPWDIATAPLDQAIGGIAGPIATIAVAMQSRSNANAILKNKNATTAEKDEAIAMKAEADISLGKASVALASTVAEFTTKRIGALPKIEAEIKAAELAQKLDTFTAVSTAVTTPLSLTSSVLGLVFSSVSLHSSKKVTSALQSLQGSVSASMEHYLEYAERKNRTKRNKRAIAVAEFSLSTGSSLAGLAATLAVGTSVVAIATPIGWALGAGAAFAGIGLGSYKAGRALYKYTHRQNKAERLLADLNLHNQDAITYFIEELGLSPAIALQQMRDKSEKAKVKKQVYEHYRHKRERMAAGLKAALVMGNQQEQADAREILIKLGFKEEKVEELKLKGGEKLILRKLNSG